MKTIVIDFDGTLSDLTHRLHFIKGGNKNWDAFFDQCALDSVNPWCVQLMRAMSYYYEYKIVIVSGRPERVRFLSEHWLEVNKVPYDELVLVRKDGDHSPDDKLKEIWLKSYGAENILFSVDDRQRVVDMWRKNGVVCLQCAQWSEE